MQKLRINPSFFSTQRVPERLSPSVEFKTKLKMFYNQLGLALVKTISCLKDASYKDGCARLNAIFLPVLKTELHNAITISDEIMRMAMDEFDTSLDLRIERPTLVYNPPDIKFAFQDFKVQSTISRDLHTRLVVAIIPPKELTLQEHYIGYVVKTFKTLVTYQRAFYNTCSIASSIASFHLAELQVAAQNLQKSNYYDLYQESVGQPLFRENPALAAKFVAENGPKEPDGFRIRVRVPRPRNLLENESESDLSSISPQVVPPGTRPAQRPDGQQRFPAKKG